MPDSEDLRFSVVIPAYNEEGYLPALLDSLDRARERTAETVEVIVADNISSDRTAEIAQGRGCRVVREQQRMIAAVRNAGALVARGEILVFVDADSRVHPDLFLGIEGALTGRVVAGATGVRMERMSLGIAVTYAVLVPFVWVTAMDTGAVFCRREDFQRVGGYHETRLYAEDLSFLWRLRRLGRSRTPRQKLVRVRAAKTVTSTRKFDRYGDWHYFRVISQGLYGIFVSRKVAQRFAQQYWYDDDNR